MRKSIGILFLTLIGLSCIQLTPAEVTHEEIRGTLQSLIYSYNQLDNKLERHEHRERALGELMKKAMMSLQKGQKNLEPINGIFARLDDRVSQIETMLIAQEEKYNIQTEKLGEALEHIFKWMRENNECYKRPPMPLMAPPPATTPAPQIAAPPAVTPEFVKQQQQTNDALLQKLTTLSTNVQQLLDASKDIKAQTEVTVKSVPHTVEMLNKLEDKLQSYSLVTPAPVVECANNTLFEEKVLEQFGLLNGDIVELRLTTATAATETASKLQEGLSALDREFMQTLANETLHALEQIKQETLNATAHALDKTTGSLQESATHMATHMQQLNEGVNGTTDILQKFYNEMNASYSKLNEGLEIFSKFNTILMTNSEYVLDTQRKVEFGTHQVVQKIGDLLEKQRDEVSALLKQRFDELDETVVNNHVDAMQNLSSLMETEISHVWRQIEIMHSEITDSKDLLNMLQGKTEIYVNSTFATMGSMDDKVQHIAGRMIDLDTNLNFLLGKLALMAQEFANIKIGLGDALDQVRVALQSVQHKMVKEGPGPHNIAGNEYETELKLLKRNAA